MKSPEAPGRRPDPAPLRTDDVRAVAIGTALWVAALAAALVAHGWLANHGHSTWVGIALAGIFLGLVGLRHLRRRRSRTHPDRS